MNQLIGVILFILACGLAKNSIAGTTRIIGGKPTTIEEHPYQVAIWTQYQYLQYTGGASIISENYVVTAAHMYHLDRMDRYRVHVGSTNKSEGIVLQINNIIYHPKYDFYNHDYDVAVMELSSPLEFNERIQPIPLHTTRPDVSEAIVSGWGWLNSFGELPDLLQELPVPIIDQDLCIDIYEPNITDRMICAGYLEEQMGFCHSDDGAGLVVDGKLLGIVSWQFGSYCIDEGYVGVYAYVPDPELNSFISQYI